MQLHWKRIVSPVVVFSLVISAVSCNRMPFRGFGGWSSNSHGMQSNPDPRYQQQPYYQGQRQLRSGGQIDQRQSVFGHGGRGNPSSSGDYGYPSAPSHDSPPAGGGAGTSHVVTQGETLWSISKKYATSVAAIRSANSLSGDLIRPGDVLQIP